MLFSVIPQHIICLIHCVGYTALQNFSQSLLVRCADMIHWQQLYSLFRLPYCGKSRSFAVWQGSEINFWFCLSVLLRTRQFAKCWFSTHCFIFLLIFCLETLKDGSGPTNSWKETSLGTLSAPCHTIGPSTDPQQIVSLPYFDIHMRPPIQPMIQGYLYTDIGRR
jgi:hypothetical protein